MAKRFQTALADYCRLNGKQAPLYQMVSDRRGGRTAWSSMVVVMSQQISARYWYDGSFIENAKEDAAECALQKIQPAAARATGDSGVAYEEEKTEPGEETMPEGAVGRVGQENKAAAENFD